MVPAPSPTDRDSSRCEGEDRLPSVLRTISTEDESMFRAILATAVVITLCACGASATADPTGIAAPASVPPTVEATQSPSPTPTPTPTPTPSPSPTPSVGELGQAYLAAADAFNASVCEGNAILEEGSAGSDAEYLVAAVEAFGMVGEAAGQLREELAEIGLESTFWPELEEMQAAVAQRQEAYEAVAAATSLDEASEIVEAMAVPATDRMTAASQALRSALGLPDAPADVCVREVEE